MKWELVGSEATHSMTLPWLGFCWRALSRAAVRMSRRVRISLWRCLGETETSPQVIRAPSGCNPHPTSRWQEAFRASVHTDCTCVGVARKSPSVSPVRYLSTPSAAATRRRRFDTTWVTAWRAMSRISASAEERTLEAPSTWQASLVSAATGMPAAPAAALP
ncbi:unnamed protein product [Ixodes pacificus]